MPRLFLVTAVTTREDLQDTPFIRDEEVLSCFYAKDTSLIDEETSIMLLPEFTVADSVGERIKKLEIPSCCGRQFALVVDGKIIYTGYFWNIRSSFGSDAITASACGSSIAVSKGLPPYQGLEDPLRDPFRDLSLIGCLKSTNRFREN